MPFDLNSRLSVFGMEITELPGNTSFTKSKMPLLKDFLQDESDCSNNVFQCSNQVTVKNILDLDLDSYTVETTPKLYRTRSRAASVTVLSLQKASEAVINAIRRRILFCGRAPPSVKQAVFLCKLSRKIRRWIRSKGYKCFGRSSTKDQEVRWTPFSEIVADSRSITFSASIGTNKTNGSSKTNSSKNSWSESDFSSKPLQHSSTSSECSVDRTEECGHYLQKRNGVVFDQSRSRCGKSKIEEMQRRTTETTSDDEQLSPGSVLDFPANEEQETPPSTSLQQSMKNVARRAQRLLEKIRRFEGLTGLDPVDLQEMIALLEVDSSSSIDDTSETQELSTVERTAGPRSQGFFLDLSHNEHIGTHDEIFTDELQTVPSCGDQDHCFELRKRWVICSTTALIDEIELERRWGNFEEEKEEIAVQTEKNLWWWLLDELLSDLPVSRLTNWGFSPPYLHFRKKASG